MSQPQRLEPSLQDLVCAELDPRLNDLFVRVRPLEGGFTLLRFFAANVNTLRTADDIAYHVCLPVAAVDKSLRTLSQMDLVRRMQAAGITLYGLTENPQKRRLVRDLGEWQDRWLAQIQQIDRLINGQPRPLDAERTRAVHGLAG